MVGEYENLVCCTFEVVPPVLERVLDRVEFLVVDLVVAFGGGKGSGVEGDGVDGVVGWMDLGEDGSERVVRGVGLEYAGERGVVVCEDR